MPVRAAQAEVVVDAAGALMQQAVEHRGVAVAVERVQNVEPARGRPLERAALEAELRLDLAADVDLVGGDVPIEDRVARTRHRERAPLGVGSARAQRRRRPRTRSA